MGTMTRNPLPKIDASGVAVAPIKFLVFFFIRNSLLFIAPDINERARRARRMLKIGAAPRASRAIKRSFGWA
jgi:hypothetical protein